jgi:energy-coupling factor transport system substrate-specific component
MSWQVGSTALVTLVLAAGVTWYERSRPPSRLVALVAALAALAIAGRVLFTPIPNVQGTTDIVLLSGYALGPLPGFVVGAIAALTSNFFLGQGPWTPWQMLGWGMAGVGGGALAAVLGTRLGRWPLALFCAAAGFAFGAWMDLFTVMTFAADRSAASYVTVAGVSFPFNAAHAIGNAVLCLALGPAFVRMLVRFRDRMQIEWVSLARMGGTGTAAVALAALVLAGAAAVPARAADRSLRYLEQAQNADGGFGGAPGQPSNQLLTGWAVIGLEAGGRNPLDVRKGGKSAIDYTRAHLPNRKDTGDLERTILALEGAGLDATRVGGRNLVAELIGHRRGDGSFEGQSNWTAFGVLALRAAGRSAKSAEVKRSAAWLARQQNDDGGFSFAMRGGGSFVDETGAALQGLAAGGRRRSPVVTRALRYLRKAQNQDGGYGQTTGYRSNAQSTSWAIQGIVAARKDPSRFGRKGRSPLVFLASLRAGDGSYRYSRSSTQTPVWVTAQAIAAVRRKAFPLKPVPRHIRLARARLRRTSLPRLGHAKPVVQRLGRAHRPRAAATPPPPRRALEARPVAGVRHDRGVSAGSDGSSLVRALPITGAVLVLAAAVFAFRRKHV